MSAPVVDHYLLDTAVFVPHLQSLDFRGAVREMVEHLCDGSGLSVDARLTIVNEMLLREKSSGSTAIGNGVAIPHLYLSDRPDWTTRAGWFRSPAGLDFENNRGQSVSILLCILAHDHSVLPLLGRGRLLLEKSDFRDKMRASSCESAMKEIVRQHLSLNVPPSAIVPVAGHRYRRSVKVHNANGLHATPCANLVRLVRSFDCRVVLSYGDAQADATSIMDLLTFSGTGAGVVGSTIEVETSGPDAAEALDAICKFFDNHFTGTD